MKKRLLACFSVLCICFTGCGSNNGSASGAELEKAENAVSRTDEIYASTERTKPSPEWVTDLDAAKDEKVKQLFVVAGMGMDKTTATVSMNQRDENGNWQQILASPGFVGKNGMCLDADHAEGVGQTPIGV